MTTITYQDGTHNKAYVYSGKAEKGITFICLPALGVRASYYQPFNEKLNERGFNVVCIDWRGNGHSSERASRKNNWGYKELIQDVREIVDFTAGKFPDTKKYFIGHSLGGQIGCLLGSRFPEKIHGHILIACCLVHYTGWSGIGQLKVRAVGNLFYPLSKLVGYFPGTKIGFGGNEARTVMKDWSHNALTGKYEITRSDFDYETSLKEMKKPVLAISIKNDELAPVKATKNLYKKFSPETPVEHLIISKEDAKTKSLNHFNWAKQPEYFVEKIEEWTKN